MLQNLNIRHLLAALAVHELGTISATAQSVHLSQSAVTQGLANLESLLGQALFVRSNTGLYATDSGLAFLNRAQRAVQWLQAIQNITRQHKRRPLARLLTATQLRALIAVVDAGSYTLAARQLELTQPTVHRAVRELESFCDEPLFRRSPNGVEPTWLAQQMARFGNLFYQEIEQGVEELAETAGEVSGSLRIGSLPLARTKMVPQAVSEILNTYPQARVQIIDGPYEEQLQSLLNGRLDVIVGALRYPLPSKDVEQEYLFTDRLNIVVRAGHWLAESQVVEVRALSELNWIAPRMNTPAREVFTQFFRREGLEPPGQVIECSSLVAIRELLRESDRAALLPAKQVEIDVELGLLAVSPLTLEGTARDIGLSFRRDWRPTKLQNTLVNILRARYGVAAP